MNRTWFRIDSMIEIGTETRMKINGKAIKVKDEVASIKVKMRTCYTGTLPNGKDRTRSTGSIKINADYLFIASADTGGAARAGGADDVGLERDAYVNFSGGLPVTLDRVKRKRFGYSHFGIVKMKEAARAQLWFPAAAFLRFARLRPAPPRAPLASWPHPPS
ncbi:hypothetical protein EVAR_14051_1 [Eumeta japonica]|uniref:Uncharacterized protein n=1 Tax=Eumeta variegata TaxID=151549 RepID=A0A4C1UN44_EUMVA|nr:hypothetical protein EVAR_14051_1 [Eumeta japonica]